MCHSWQTLANTHFVLNPFGQVSTGLDMTCMPTSASVEHTDLKTLLKKSVDALLFITQLNMKILKNKYMNINEKQQIIPFMVAKMIDLPADSARFDGSQEHNSGLMVGNRRTEKNMLNYQWDGWKPIKVVIKGKNKMYKLLNITVVLPWLTSSYLPSSCTKPWLNVLEYSIDAGLTIVECKGLMFGLITINTEPLIGHAVSATNDCLRWAVAACFYGNFIAWQQTVQMIQPCFTPLILGCRLTQWPWFWRRRMVLCLNVCC